MACRPLGRLDWRANQKSPVSYPLAGESSCDLYSCDLYSWDLYLLISIGVHWHEDALQTIIPWPINQAAVMLSGRRQRFPPPSVLTACQSAKSDEIKLNLRSVCSDASTMHLPRDWLKGPFVQAATAALDKAFHGEASQGEASQPKGFRCGVATGRSAEH